jgi:pimeloyl-ACP methyl ester carboxylesterase
VLVHGLGGRWQHYREVMPGLSARCRVVAIDLPGFGSSPLAGKRLAFDDHVAAVAAVLEDAGIRQVVLAGHSMGGPLALRFAEAHPDSARALILVCGTVQSFQRTLAGAIRPWLSAPLTAVATVAEVILASTSVPRRLRRPLANSAWGRRLALWPFVHRPGRLPADRALLLIEGAGARGVRPTARALGRISGWERPRYAGLPPVYAINGGRDRIAPLGDLESFELPLERSVVLEESGHMVMLEAADAFGAAVRRIVDDSGLRPRAATLQGPGRAQRGA